MEKIKSQIETLLYAEAEDFEIAKVLKKDIKNYFETLEESFANSGGKDFLVKHTHKIDTLIEMVYMIATRSMFGTTYAPTKHALPITLVALGSYGREQLCVHSDIDLMIVYKDVQGYHTKEMMEKILYILWDTGLKLGHRVHEVDELFDISQTDITIKTSMIESRFVEGSKYLWTEVENELNRIRHYKQEEFIEAKIEEMRNLHKRFPMTMEPNLKEGVGGFRNANLVYWLGNILYNVTRIRDLPKDIVADKEYREFHIAQEFLFRVRSALHLSRGKKEDRVRLELIPQIAKYLGYNEREHMKFAKEVTRCLKVIKLHTTIWTDALDNDDKSHMLRPKEIDDSFESLLGQLCDAGDMAFEAHPTFLLALSRASKPKTVNEDIYTIVRKMFSKTHCSNILKPLLDTNLLGYVMRPMKQIINLPQFDGYHRYAVGIHSLKALQNLENIEDTTLKSIYDSLKPEEKALLKFATLLHDAGKGRREEHAIVGAKLFKNFAEKLLFSKKQIKIGTNLILYHSIMSSTAQREDLHTEQTILRFASRFPTKLELDFIYLLTYSDMNAVGVKTYNDFNARLLRTLYTQSNRAISCGEKLYETNKRLKKEKILQNNSEFMKFSRLFQKKILRIPSDLLFMKYSSGKIIEIVKTAREIEDYSFSIDNNGFLTIEVIRKDNLDLSYLLYRLRRLDIVNMDICKLFDGVKYFKIDFNEMADEDELLLIENIIREALKKVHQLNLENPNIDKKAVTIDCNHSQEHGMMKLHCSNRKGLLSHIISIFDKLGIDICSAKIHTKTNRVNDLFLIEKNGNFCHNTDFIIKELTE
ncbi:HD domain-containing protein [Sulfurovum sp. bin170]|uniref:[protein-PII] uridylyltransferase family protein n=1 Tax=Sulfurovum sp. bin170 TaxID=2695268 RepID=UPI0013DF28CB|nr:HD domain-containing protein [Sulfurovum sp. bin170]NEW61338.1 HD domain-containing protein [Sulfurovum sp. bin170]